MSNKTSDKNVGSIEEDVDELKSIMNLRTVSGFAYSQKNTLSLQKAIKNVLTDYTRQKQINKEHQKINGELRERVKELERGKPKMRMLNCAYSDRNEDSVYATRFAVMQKQIDEKDKRIQELEEQVKTLDEAYTGVIKESKKWFDIAHNSIPMQVVIDKMEELNKEIKNGDEIEAIFKIKQQQILQELLERGNK